MSDPVEADVGAEFVLILPADVAVVVAAGEGEAGAVGVDAHLADDVAAVAAEAGRAAHLQVLYL